MSIIFCGDLVLPYYVTVDYKEVVPLFEDCKAIANMEGALLKEEKELNLYRWRDKFFFIFLSWCVGYNESPPCGSCFPLQQSYIGLPTRYRRYS